VKKSKLERKFLNQMRGMSDIPWPARRFRYPPTSGPMLTNKRCERVLQRQRRRRRGWRGIIDLIRRRKPVLREYFCGAPLVLVPHSANRHGHLACIRCGPRRRR
jgi:hypothetical protein